jgi:hypothetical protein
MVSNHFVLSSLLALHRVFNLAVPFAVSVFLICSCAKQDALSIVQKNQIQLTLSSAGLAYNAALANIQSPSQSRESSSTDGSIVTLKKMTKSLQDRIKARDCRLRYIAPDSYSAESVQSIRRTFVLLKLWGDSRYCPVSIDFKIGTLLEPSIGRWAVSYDYSYSVSDSSYRTLNDIDSIDLHGGTSLNGIGTSQVRSETDFKGTLHSQTLGDITIESYGKLTGNDADSLNGENTLVFNYSDFTAEFTKTFDHGNISFMVNQESVDESTFNQYFTQGGDPFVFAINTNLIR